MSQSFKFLLSIVLFYSALNTQQVKSQSVEITEMLSEYIPANIQLMSESGVLVDLKEEITIPTVISFVYFNCPGVCSPLMNEISHIIDNSDLEPGKDYQFFTISFNPFDNTELAVEKKKNYLEGMVKKNYAEKGWKFFTADSINIAKVTETLGFDYQKVGDEFNHMAAMILINSKGMISRYNIGIHLLPIELEMSIESAEKNQVLPKLSKSDEYCYPTTVPVFQRLNGVAKQAGIIILAITASLFILLIIRPIIKNRKPVN